MTCYTRHLTDLLPETPTTEDRRRLDEVIRRELGVPATAGCPEVWAAVKATDRGELEARIRPEL